ncbi:MAG TPA: amino acid adenylation domain-containing protein, partial [Candidatus Deferrimicrobium sp.]|nr:amino acid adenylation domain-containing protein [Candidatus Deferrimicrobium sp.]
MTDDNPKKLYKTGDLARWLPDGNIEFLGRIDQQVKVRGFRIELGEIESCLALYPAIKEAVVTAREHENGGAYLCAYVISQTPEHPTVSQLREFLAKRLPDYMIPAYFIQLIDIPLTPNGKIDKKALPEPDYTFIDTGVEYVPPFSSTEKKLALIWQSLLAIKRIGVMDDFFQLGGDSILVNRCIARIREEFHAELPLRKFFEHPFIKALAEEIEKQERRVSSIKSAERVGEIPLSFAQERLWFLQELDAGNAAYFVPRVIRMKGKLEVSLIERTFTEIIRRHEILRTVFPTSDGQPVQRIQPPYAFKIAVLDWTRIEEMEQERHVSHFLNAEGRRSFDFEKGPLLRVTILKLKEEEHLFVLTEHHLVHDGWTQGVLLNEFIRIFTAYSQEREHDLPGLPIQYADYAIWQRNYLKGEVLAWHLNYWLEKLSGLPPVFDLPADRPRPPFISGQGGLEIDHLPDSYASRLKEFSRQNGSTLFMTMLAVFKILLYRYTGVGDLCVGTGIANRRYKEMEGMLGMVINTLPLRTHVVGEISFKQCLNRVKETCLEAYQHEDTPFGKIVEVMQPVRSLGYSPIFQVMFTFMDTPAEGLRLPGLELELLPGHNRSAKFDINIVVVPPPEHESSENGGNGEMLVEWEYNTDIFDSPTVTRMISHYQRLLDAALEKPGTNIAILSMLSDAEVKRVLYEFNDTETAYPREKTIHRLFAEQAARTPDNIAVFGHGHASTTRTKEEEKSGIHFTYKELNGQSDRLAGLLTEKGVQADNIVAVMMERSIDLITAILGILKAGGAYLPIDPGYPRKRIDYMLKDSNVKIIVGDKHACPEELNCQLSIINCELLMNGPAATFHHSSFIVPHSNHLSYIIYTSGSTGQPRGVMVTHRNVIRLVKNTNFIALTGETRILQTGAPVFDASTFEIWGSLLNGGQLALVDKEIILDSHRLGDALKRHRINTLWLSAPLFNRLQQQDSELFAPLDYLLVGGDVLSPEHINNVRRKFPGLKIINGYGPTENTTFSTTYLIEKEFEQSIPIGRAIANSTVYICDKNRQLVPVGIWGELYAGGDGVSRGYLNNPELSAEKFNKSYRSYKSYRTYNFYKTGDLARWLPDGNIEFLGRIDRQVKIRGFRVELGEIESRLLKHGQVKEAVVIDRKTGEEKYLCAYIVPLNNPGPGASELKSFLAGSLPGYMLPSFIVFIDKIPLNPNGKVDRKALPDPANDSATIEYTAPRNKIEEKLVGIWAEVLKPGSPIGIDDNFFDLGGHSLNATLLITRMHKMLKVKIPFKEFFQKGCIREVAEYIYEAGTVEFTSIEPVEKQEYYPLSAAQKRLYIIRQMDEMGVAYNIPAVMKLAGRLDKNHLESVFKQLLHRHESLRTSFIVIDGVPVQQIQEFVDFSIAYDEAGNAGNVRPVGSSYPYFIRPFDLSKAPLMRVALLKEDDETHFLMVDMHHIITDGTSMELLVKEFMALYEGMELPPLKLQYKDYSCWQGSEQEKNVLRVQEEFWLKQFSEMPAALNLPLDYPRPVVQSFEGRGCSFEITGAETAALKELASGEGTTLYMVLLSLYFIFLARISGQEDIVVGSPVAGRTHADLEPIIGMFVNTLALRNNPAGGKNVLDFLKEVNDNTLTAFANQDYPYEELVEKAAVHRDTGRNPLFDTMLNLRNMNFSEIKIPGLTMTPFPFQENISKFDISLRAFDDPGNLRFTFEFSTKLFKMEAITRFIAYFKNIIKSVIEDKYSKIFALEIIPDVEKRRLLNDFNLIEVDYPEDKTIHELFIEQAARIPDCIAIAGSEEKVKKGNTHLSYRELNERSGKLGGWLIEKGVQPENIVGIMMERGIELIINLLSILKAGGVYLPMDPHYPQERIDYILKDSGATILMNKSVNFDIVSNFDIRTSHFNSSNLAYIIYTSGTTGRPKGVAIRHKSFVNLIYFHRRIFEENRDSRISQVANPAFDAMGFEIWPCLASGAALCIVDNETRLSSTQMRDWLIRRGITVSFQPTVMAEQLLEEHWPSEGVGLKSLCAAGDKLNRYPGLTLPFKLYNLYGPTEDTVWTTWALVETEPKLRFPVIGKPIANHNVYILNSYLKLQPVGIPGELCISGTGLAQGYLNNPELTAEKFNKDLWDVQDDQDEKNKSFVGVIYRTGDLARCLEDGNIEFLGRIDHQVKIRGFRIELAEIESRLLSYDKIKDAVVITKEDRAGEPGQYILCAYFTANEVINSPALHEYLSAALPDYMIPAYFVQLDSMPLTPNGKLDKRALPEPVIKAGESYVAARTAIEEKMVALWAEILGRTKSSIGIDDNFFQLGGHSLKATILAAKIHKLFAVPLTLTEIFKTPRIRELAAYIKSAERLQYEQIAPAEKKEYYLLSSAQTRLYFLQQMDPGTTAYNISAAWILEGYPDRKKLEDAFLNLVKRHESFRTSFVIVGKEPVQQIHDDVEFAIAFKDLATEVIGVTENTEVINFIRAFDLTTAPLFRAGLVKLAEEKHILV